MFALKKMTGGGFPLANLKGFDPPLPLSRPGFLRVPFCWPPVLVPLTMSAASIIGLERSGQRTGADLGISLGILRLKQAS